MSTHVGPVTVIIIALSKKPHVGLCLLVSLLVPHIYQPPSLHAAQQDDQAIAFTLIPEMTQLEAPHTLMLISIVHNHTDQPIDSLDFTLANPSFTMQPQTPLPATIPAHQTITGTYLVEVTTAGHITLVGLLAYRLDGSPQRATTQASLEFVPTSPFDEVQDAFLILLGAFVSLLGGFLMDLWRGYSERRRVFQQQTRKALGVLVSVLEVSRHAIEHEKETPIDLWQEAYFKEGLHTTLVEYATTRKMSEVVHAVADLYVRLTEYNTLVAKELLWKHPTLIEEVQDEVTRLVHGLTALTNQRTNAL